MHKVSVMSQTPTTCLYCGRGNTPDDPDTMDDFFAVDLERDVNWGDSTYLCKYCAEVLAALVGFVTMDQLTEQMNLNERLKQKIHDLEATLEERTRRLKQIARGRKALKKSQAELAPKKKKAAA